MDNDVASTNDYFKIRNEIYVSKPKLINRLIH
jgi:hypothetical protein